MSRYSIKELESLSGIKAHTIRIWEKRYRIISPHRTATNIRSYSDEDLKRIIIISLLNNHGLKISKIANLTPAALAAKASEISANQTTAEVHIDRLVVAMVDLDEEKFESILNELIQRLGFEEAMTNVVYPFLSKIGVLWLTGNITPLQEHFISNLLRQKILVAIDGLPRPKKSAKSILMFLHDEELHEIGLLFSHYVVRKSGFRTYYMGQRVPYADVHWFCEHHKPSAMITSITSSPTPQFVEHYLARLSTEHPDISVFASGHRLKKMALKIPSNLHIFDNTEQLKALLRGLRSA